MDTLPKKTYRWQISKVGLGEWENTHSSFPCDPWKFKSPEFLHIPKPLVLAQSVLQIWVWSERVSISAHRVLFPLCQTASVESMCHSKWLTEVSVKDPPRNDSEIAKGLEQALNTEGGCWVGRRGAGSTSLPVKHRVLSHWAAQSRFRGVLGRGTCATRWLTSSPPKPSGDPKTLICVEGRRSGSETAQDIPFCWNTSLLRVKLCSCPCNVISPLASFTMPQNEPAPREINDACSVGSMQALAWKNAAPKPPSPSVKAGKLMS